MATSTIVQLCIYCFIYCTQCTVISYLRIRKKSSNFGKLIDWCGVRSCPGPGQMFLPAPATDTHPECGRGTEGENWHQAHLPKPTLLTLLLTLQLTQVRYTYPTHHPAAHPGEINLPYTPLILQLTQVRYTYPTHPTHHPAAHPGAIYLLTLLLTLPLLVKIWKNVLVRCSSID